MFQLEETCKLSTYKRENDLEFIPEDKSDHAGEDWSPCWLAMGKWDHYPASGMGNDSIVMCYTNLSFHIIHL